MTTMKLRPEDFPTVMNGELRELWKRYRDPDVRRLILEVHRAREVMNAAHGDALKAQYALWEKKEGDVRAALQNVTDRLLFEKTRLGAFGGISPSR